jgi:serine/threonine-protein kinase
MSDVRLWTFANYRIRDILDVDLVSTTYRATTVDGDELRRVRVFTGDAADGELADIHDAMIAELRAASRITHPHILTTHDAGRHDGRVYVVSDDVQGAVLREFITRHQPLRPRMALEMGWQLAEALDAVHAAGVVHGSINPHTIWVSDAAGRGPVAYLTGFGSALMLARQVRNQQKAPASDDLLYVGPDQMRREQASPEADRYALACAVYHLMTSVPPFRRDSVNALFGAHLFSAVEPPTGLREDLPPALDSVFARALAKETSDRYPSSNALMIGIERGLRGQEEPRRTAAAGEPRSHHGTWTVGAGAGAIGPSWDARDRAGNGAAPEASADRAGNGAAPEASADRAGNGAAPPGDRPDEITTRAGQVPAPELDPQVGQPDGHRTAEPDARNESDSPPEADPAVSDAPPAPPGPRPGADGDVAASGVVADGRSASGADGDVAASAAVADGGTAQVDDEPDRHVVDTGDAGPGDDAAEALVETPSGNGPRPRPSRDGADAGTAPPVTVERPQRRSQEHPEALFDWSGGTLDERRAEHTRRNGDLTARDKPRGVAPPMPVSADEAVPGTRRVGTRTTVLLAIGAVLVLAAAGAMIAAGWRDDPSPAAAPQPVDEPVAPPRAAPQIVQPLWTTPVADTAVREIVETDGAVLVNAGRTIGALEPASGNLLWTAGTDARVTELHVLGATVVAATADGLVSYDIATGDVRWRSEDGAAVPEALTSGRREIFATSREPGSINISTIDPDDGTVAPLGTIPSNADPDAGGIALVFDRSAARKGGRTLYVLTRAGLYAFDPTVGAEIWRAPVSTDGQFDEPELREEPWVRSLEAIAGAAFVVGRDGRICRYGAATGEEVWTTCQRFGAELEDAPVVYARDARVIVASPVAVAAYDFTNGLRQWSRTLADELQASVAGSPDLTYVAREDGVLRALDHDSGLERWRAQDIGDVTALLGDAQGVYVGGGDGDVMRVAQQALGGSDNR